MKSLYSLATQDECATSGAKTAYPSGFTSVFCGVLVGSVVFWYPYHMLFVELWEPSCKSSSLPVDRYSISKGAIKG